MVILCRAEDLPSSSATFPKLHGISDGSVRGDRMYFSIGDEKATVTGKTNETKANEVEEELWSRESCTTPTSKEYRIPEMLTCPPAPKKRRDSSVSRLTSVPMTKDYFVPSPNFESIFVLDSKVSSTVK